MGRDWNHSSLGEVGRGVIRIPGKAPIAADILAIFWYKKENAVLRTCGELAVKIYFRMAVEILQQLRTHHSPFDTRSLE